MAHLSKSIDARAIFSLARIVIDCDMIICIIMTGCYTSDMCKYQLFIGSKYII